MRRSGLPMTHRHAVDITRSALLAVLLVGLCIAPGQGADRSLGTFESWSAISYSEDKRPVCMMWSQPEKSEGDYTRRGDVFVFITHRPGDDEINKVRFETGYTFEKSSEVAVDIDGKKFRLATDNSTAWTMDPGDNALMVSAMRAGDKMVARGTSSRGTLTTDTYSLRGFTAAHNAINKACRK